MLLRRRLRACVCFINMARAFTGTMSCDKHVSAHAAFAAGQGLHSGRSPSGALPMPAKGQSTVGPRAALATPTVGASSCQPEDAGEALAVFDTRSWSSDDYTDYSTGYDSCEAGSDYCGELLIEWPRPAFAQQPSPPPPCRAGPLAAYMNAIERRPILTKAVTSGFVCALGDILAQALSFYSTRGAGAAAAAAAGGFLGNFQVSRLAVYAFLGAAYLAPVVHVWFGMLEQIVSRLSLKTGPARCRGRWVGHAAETGGGDGGAQAAAAAAAAVAHGNDNNPSFRARMSKAAQMTFVDQLLGAPLVNAGLIFGFALLSSGGGFGPLAVRGAAERVSATLGPTLLACWRVWPVVSLVNFAFVPPGLRLLFVNCVGLFWNVFLSILMTK